MNLLTKFHEDQTINVASGVHIWKNAPPLGSHVFQANVSIFKCHEDWTINVASREFTRQMLTPHNGQRTIDKRRSQMCSDGSKTIFELNRRIQEKNVLTNKWHEDLAKNVSSRLFTCFHYIHIEKTAPPSGGHVFSMITTIFKLNQDIYKTNVLTKLNDDWTINMTSRTKHVTSRVFTCFHYIHIEKTVPPPGGHVLSPIWTLFELVRDINKTNVLTKIHDDWAKIVTSRVFTRNTAQPSGGHTNEYWASNVTSTVLTSFELGRDIIRTHFLTKFDEDRTIKVASRVFTRRIVDDKRRTTDDGQKAISMAHHDHVVLR
ncbi:hypothetical protein DPMN_193210 [Dreissena polymorpha]|uniref:Uncharacterized protein n=1 Tax=Dreissena polymorpha TaxID=45954 RepID=A0A9D3Y452_DREPO|nr:hypothetical protein DPMN_193210 [Dreissena polymorpha]